MKVLHVINHLGPGGAEMLIRLTLPRMNAAGVPVEVVILTEQGQVFAQPLREQGIPVHALNRRTIYSPANIAPLRALIRDRGCDIVHSHLFPSIYWTAWAARGLRRPDGSPVRIVTTEHNTHNRRRTRIAMRPVERNVYRRHHAVIAISDTARSNLLDWIGAGFSDRVRTITNGVEVARFASAEPVSRSDLLSGSNAPGAGSPLPSPIPTTSTLPSAGIAASPSMAASPRIVTMVARFNEQKDQPTLIRALSQLPDNVHLVFVGTGPLEASCRQLAETRGVSSRVHFLGYRDDVERVLKASDVIALSSRWEGLSLFSVEAMASGKPFVATDAPGLREVVSGAGLLFPIGDHAAAAQCINSLLSDDDLARRTARHCSARAQHYDLSNMVEQYLGLYHELLAR